METEYSNNYIYQLHFSVVTYQSQQAIYQKTHFQSVLANAS